MVYEAAVSILFGVLIPIALVVAAARTAA